MTRDIKDKIPEIWEEHQREESSFKKIVPALIKKGIDNVNLSMFTPEVRNELLNAAGDEFVSWRSLNPWPPENYFFR